MSMHRIPLTEVEEYGLRAHGLDIGTPSQLSDAFRQGLKYGQLDSNSEIAELKRQLEEANEQADIHRQWNLGYMKSNETHREALLAALAREARLREALECYRVNGHYEQSYNLACSALALPHDDTALKEYIEKTICNSSKGV